MIRKVIITGVTEEPDYPLGGICDALLELIDYLRSLEKAHDTNAPAVLLQTIGGALTRLTFEMVEVRKDGKET